MFTSLAFILGFATRSNWPLVGNEGSFHLHHNYSLLRASFWAEGCIHHPIVSLPACSQEWICIQVSNQLGGPLLYGAKLKKDGETSTGWGLSALEVGQPPFLKNPWWGFSLLDDDGRPLRFFQKNGVVGEPTNRNKRLFFRWTLRGFGVGLSRGRKSPTNSSFFPADKWWSSEQWWKCVPPWKRALFSEQCWCMKPLAIKLFIWNKKTYIFTNISSYLSWKNTYIYIYYIYIFYIYIIFIFIYLFAFQTLKIHTNSLFKANSQ